MRKKSARYYAMNGMDEVEIEAEGGVILKTDDGQRIEIYYRESDGEINISAGGRIAIKPMASNCFRVEDLK